MICCCVNLDAGELFGIFMVDVFCCVNLDAGELFGTFILA
jgi:hypothetical protein